MPNKPKTGKIIACKTCGKEVYVPLNRIDTFKYCSRSCLALDAREIHTSNCLVCGKSFEHISSRANKAKYCSRKCYYKAMSKVGSIETKCAHCGKIILTSPSRPRKYCSKKCLNKSTKEIWKPAFITVRKNMKRRGMIEKCELCGYDTIKDILGIHHKDGNRLNNDIKNLVVLCPNCHSIMHNRHVVHSGKRGESKCRINPMHSANGFIPKPE